MKPSRMHRCCSIGLRVAVAIFAFVPAAQGQPAAMPPKQGTNPESPSASAQGSDTAARVAAEPEPTPEAVAQAPSGPREPPADRVETTESVAPSTIEVTTLDGQSNPVAGVHLELLRGREPAGDDRWKTVTDRAGNAKFNQVPPGSGQQYRVVAVDEGRRYGTRPFALEAGAGTRVVLHVYPLVHDTRQALFAGRGFVFVQPRDETLAFEYMQHFQYFGQSVLVVDDIELALPNGWKAFSTEAGDADLQVIKTERGVKLSGLMSPGQHSVFFSFQIPSANRERVDLDLDLWPNTVEAQVATIARTGLELLVEGFPNSTVTLDNNRQPFLLTRRSFANDSGPPPSIHVEIAGLPVIGPGRWVAAAAAAALGLWALLSALAKRTTTRTDDSRAAARARIVDELAALELAHRQGKLGDSAYSDTREILLSAFVRIEREPLSN